MKTKHIKIKFLKKLSSLELVLAILVGVLPQTTFVLATEATEHGLTVNETKVAFAGHEWWVIGANGKGVYQEQSNHITLLAASESGNDEPFGTTFFRTSQSRVTPGYTHYTFTNPAPNGETRQGYFSNNPSRMGLSDWSSPNEYAGSNLQQQMVSIANGFPPKEQALITARDLASTATPDNNKWEYNKQDNRYKDGMAGQGISGQKLWALSKSEWETINNENVRGYGKYYWLRSPHTTYGTNVYYAFFSDTDSAYISSNIIGSNELLIRPTLSLNLSSVFLSSAAAGGKDASTVGSNLIAMTAPTGTVKFTMLDSSLSLTVNNVREQTVEPNESLYFTYSDASTGANRYISCVLTDENGNVQYYGKLKSCADSNDASGYFFVPFSGVPDGSYTLKIFLEEVNGEKNTDFCSRPAIISVNVSKSLLLNQTKVAFAGHEWWVIGTNGEGVYPQAGHITLLAASESGNDAPFGDKAFRTGLINSFGDSTYTYYLSSYYANNPSGMDVWTTPNEYAGSALQQKMVSIANDFPQKEQEVITARDFTGGGTYQNPSSDGIAGQGIMGQKLWAISDTEWETIDNYAVRSYNYTWWLRSPYFSSSTPNFGGVAKQGDYLGQDISNDIVDHHFDSTAHYKARPALSLNLSSVLFTSVASDGKSSATVDGGLAEMVTPTGTVKFTMVDDSQTLTIETIPETGNNLVFSYSNATTGENQYVSCVLRDENGNVQYYGKLASCADSNAASGSLSIPLTSVEDGTYTLLIFSEEANGEKYTDFCSRPATMTVAVSGRSGTVSNFSGNSHEHKWSSEWSNNETHHWHECMVEDYPFTDNSLKDGYAAHNYSQQVIDDKYRASSADCTHRATYYYSCECGMKGDITFTSGVALDHNFGSWISNNDGTHTRSCSRCDATQKGNCHGGTATYYKKAICEACGASYGELKKNPLDDVSDVIDGNLSANDKVMLEKAKDAVEKELANNKAAYTDKQLEELKKELDELDSLLEQFVDYEISEGSDSEWMLGSTSGLSFTVNGEYSKFISIQVDGDEVDPENYTVASDDMLITLNPDYLSTLKVGEHTLRVLYTDGEATSTFTIEEKALDSSVSQEMIDTTIPETSDNSHIIFIMVLILISSVISIWLILYKRRRNKENR